jgi:sulfate/thiosulfate transport system permease protein
MATIELAPAPLGGAGADGRSGKRNGTEAGSPLGLGSGLSLGVAVMWLSLVVLLPLAAVVSKAFGNGWHDFYAAVTDRETMAALRLTVGLALSVAVVNAVMGTVVAWVLVRERFRGAGLLELVIDLPFALPTIVAGLVMLGLYGSGSPVGIHLFGTRAGLFVALLFVTLPFTVRTVQPVLLDLDRDAEQAANSLGAGPLTTFRRIVLPPLVPAILSGAALSFARALGEYGSLVLISSNLPFKTEVASRLIYDKLQNADSPVLAVRQAAAIATVLLAASALVLVVLALLQRRLVRRG